MIKNNKKLRIFFTTAVISALIVYLVSYVLKNVNLHKFEFVCSLLNTIACFILVVLMYIVVIGSIYNEKKQSGKVNILKILLFISMGIMMAFCLVYTILNYLKILGAYFPPSNVIFVICLFANIFFVSTFVLLVILLIKRKKNK